MIKTVIIPQNDSYTLAIPKNYIGKKLEVLLYAFDELIEEKAIAKKKPSDYFGTLSKEEGEKFHVYVANAREEWNRDI